MSYRIAAGGLGLDAAGGLGLDAAGGLGLDAGQPWFWELPGTAVLAGQAWDC